MKEPYRGDLRRPLEGWTMMDYQEEALKTLRTTFPEATFSDFSGVYGLAYMNEKEIFETKACSWEYPGMWYGGTLNVTNDEFVALLAEDGRLFLENKRPKFDQRNYQDF